MGSIDQASCDIIDIRQGDVDFDLAQEINKLLNPSKKDAERQLPTLLLYDEAGLKIFEEITYLDEYYLTNAEIRVLEKHARDIAAYIPQNSQLIELGSGNLRKISILLSALDKAKKVIDYYALDLSRPELERTLEAVSPGMFTSVRCHGLWGTYDDFLHRLNQAGQFPGAKVVMTMGSSIGNFTRGSAEAFLKSYAERLQPTDIVIVGVDGCQDSAKIHLAYNDSHGVTERFYRNGLKHANKVLGYELFNDKDWQVVGEVNKVEGVHEAYITPVGDLCVKDFHFKAGERIKFETAFKYSSTQQAELWNKAGLTLQESYVDNESGYALNVLAPIT